MKNLASRMPLWEKSYGGFLETTGTIWQQMKDEIGLPVWDEGPSSSLPGLMTRLITPDSLLPDNPQKRTTDGIENGERQAEKASAAWVRDVYIPWCVKEEYIAIGLAAFTNAYHARQSLAWHYTPRLAYAWLSLAARKAGMVWQQDEFEKEMEAEHFFLLPPLSRIQITNRPDDILFNHSAGYQTIATIGDKLVMVYLSEGANWNISEHVYFDQDAYYKAVTHYVWQQLGLPLKGV
jgi:hypothetical protein